MSPSRQPAQKLSVLYVTPECAPLVKTGGLGDVSAALPAALCELGIDARVLLPGYGEVLEANPHAHVLARLTVYGIKMRLLEARLQTGVPVIVLDAPPLFARPGGPYQDANGDDWKDNARRFGVLSRVAAILGSEASPLHWRPDVVHCNDWQAALAPVFLDAAGGKRAGSLVTIHNLAFQGLASYAEARELEMPPLSLGTEGAEFYGRISFLKGGLVYGDEINTVSPTYAQEIKSPELGFGLDGVLRMRSADLHGVLNGIDTKMWDPATDPWIAQRYDAERLDHKIENKRALKERLGLGGPDDMPLVASVSRLTHQKGIDLIIEAMPEIAALPAQVIIVGAGERSLVEKLAAAQAKHPRNLATFIGFNERLAHLVEAGADMFLMPSRFEPCGMNQMYSQRYGTPPIANPTGGLIDTIDDETADPDAATGFLTRGLSVTAVVDGVRRAVKAYHDAPRWKRLQANGMAKDFGWSSAARAYAAIYSRIRSVA